MSSCDRDRFCKIGKIIFPQRSKLLVIADERCSFSLFFSVVMVDSEAEKKRLSFKDALINKYSLDEDEELCFIQTIHISGSPKHKGEMREVSVSYCQIESVCCFKEKHLVRVLSQVKRGRSCELQSLDQKFLDTQTVVISTEKLKISGVTLNLANV